MRFPVLAVGVCLIIFSLLHYRKSQSRVLSSSMPVPTTRLGWTHDKNSGRSWQQWWRWGRRPGIQSANRLLLQTYYQSPGTDTLFFFLLGFYGIDGFKGCHLSWRKCSQFNLHFHFKNFLTENNMFSWLLCWNTAPKPSTVCDIRTPRNHSLEPPSWCKPETCSIVFCL